MLEKRFGSLGNFIKKRYKLIIIIWMVVLVAFLPFAAQSSSLTNYNVENVEFAGSNHTMSSQAQSLMDSEFNSSNSSSNGTVVVLYVDSPFYSSTSYSIWNSLNSSYKNELRSLNASGILSPYSIANGVVDSISNSTYTIYRDVLRASNGTISGYDTFNSSVSSVKNFTQELKSIDVYFNSTYHTISIAVQDYSLLFSTYNSSVVSVSGLMYGIPLSYLSIYEQLPSYLSVPQRDVLAENELINATNDFNNSSMSLFYFGSFYSYWNSSAFYNSTGSQYPRLNSSIEFAFSQLNSTLNQTQAPLFYAIFKSFNSTSYSNGTMREDITRSLVYSFSSSYGAGDMQIFNSTFQNFLANGDVTLLSENITGSVLVSNDPLISEFTSQTFNMTPERFSGFFVSLNHLNNSFYEMQINDSLLSDSMKEIYQSVNIPSAVFYSGLLSNDTGAFKQYFIDYTASQIGQLSSALDQNSSAVVSSFLSEGSRNSSLDLTANFLLSNFKNYPYFSFSNPAAFVNSSLESKGNVSGLVDGNYTEAGISLSSSLFHSLVPTSMTGYIVVLSFNVSSLNGGQLGTLSSYLKSLQNHFDPVRIYSTSSDQISNGIESIAYSSLIYSLVAGIVVSVIIVGLYFRSFLLAFVPLMFFGVTMAIVLGISYLIFGIILKTTLSFIVTTLSAILILGLSTDYSVYILNRYSKERSDDKLGNTVQWAGHAVFTSGLTVILAYVVLGIFKVPIIGAGGFINALGITVALAVALTLLPSFMIMFKKRIKPSKNRVNFERVARVSRNHRRILVVVLIVIFVSTLVVYEATPTSFSLFSLIPNNSGKAGYYEMASAFGGDTLSTSFVLLTFTDQVYLNGHFNERDIGVIDKVSTALLGTPGITDLSTITYPFGQYVNVSNIEGSSLSVNTTLNQSLSFVGKGGHTVLLNFTTRSVSYTESGINAIAGVDAVMKQTVPSGVEYLIGGTPQSLLDSSNAIDASTYDIVIILAVMIFAVLAFQLTSILTPLRLLFNVGTSALLAVAVFYLVFHYLMHLPLIVFGPLFVIVTLFGVGLDYDIFLVTKAREAVMKGKSDDDAIAEAIDENGGVVLVLGFILAGVFGALIFSPIGIISEIGFAVTAGVLIDTAVSWLFLIPALMLVLKKYNWWPSHIRPGE